MSETKIPAFLTLDLDTGEKEFLDIEELKQWLGIERQAVDWLSNLSSRDQTAAKAWQHIGPWLSQLDNFIRDFANHQGNESHQEHLKNKLKAEAHTYIQKYGVRSSESADALFVSQLRETQTDAVAGYAMTFLMGQDLNFSTPIALEGAYWALEYKHGSKETVAAQREALDKLKSSWTERFRKQYNELKTDKKRLTTEVATLREQLSLIKEEIGQQQLQQKNQFGELLVNVENELADIKKTYDEKLALQSSVNYWTEKRANHQTIMWWLAGATLAVAILTGYFFLDAAYALLEETIAQVPLWKVSVMLAISTAGIWLTRLSAKIFIANLHLRTDADERVTMVQTYLALLREGNGPKDEERQLILQTLFRPSTTGFIKDDGPPGFYEAMSRTISK